VSWDFAFLDFFSNNTHIDAVKKVYFQNNLKFMQKGG